MTKRWRRSKPNRSGWWLWREDRGPNYYDYVRLLIVVSGSVEVAEDDTLEMELGRELGEYENYWEITEPTQTNMPGLWMFDEEMRDT